MVARSGNLIPALIVGTFVALVVAGLVIANAGYLFFPSSTTSQQEALSFSGYQIFSGSSSSVSYTSTCSGDAYLVVDMYNNTPNSILITNVTIYGPSLNQNATTLVSVSGNSCLNLSQGRPAIPADSDYEFVGYLTTPLAPLTNCYFLMQFGDGQLISHLLLAQS